MAKKNATNAKRTDIERDDDRRLIYELRQTRHTYQEITDIINKKNEGKYTLSLMMITKDLKAYKKAFLKELDVPKTHLMADQIVVLDRMERELWQQWERSKKDLIKKEKKEKTKSVPLKDKSGKVSGVKSESKVTETKGIIEERIGDMNIMEKLLKVWKERSELLALYETDISFGDGSATVSGQSNSCAVVYLPDNGRDKTVK